MSNLKIKFYPQDFEIKVTDKTFLNKDGSLKKTRGYKNTWHILSDDIKINYHHTVRTYYNENIATTHFIFHYNYGSDRIGGFSRRIFADTKKPYEEKKDYFFDMILMTKERFLEEITRKEEYKSILEWCLWNL